MTHGLMGLLPNLCADKLQDLCHPSSIKDTGPEPLSKLAVIQYYHQRFASGIWSGHAQLSRDSQALGLGSQEWVNVALRTRGQPYKMSREKILDSTFSKNSSLGRIQRRGEKKKKGAGLPCSEMMQEMTEYCKYCLSINMNTKIHTRPQTF